MESERLRPEDALENATSTYFLRLDTYTVVSESIKTGQAQLVWTCAQAHFEPLLTRYPGMVKCHIYPCTTSGPEFVMRTQRVKPISLKPVLGAHTPSRRSRWTSVVRALSLMPTGLKKVLPSIRAAGSAWGCLGIAGGTLTIAVPHLN